jgi:DNA-directed RNA polymerase beta' subunit
LHPGIVYQILKNIPDEDIVFMNMKKELCRPVDYMIMTIPVPPACIRPTVAMNFGLKNEDDLTRKM